MVVSRWVHISDTGGPYWALRISGAANSAKNPLPQKTREVGTYTRIKLGILSNTSKRLKSEIKELYDQVALHMPDCAFTSEDDEEAYAAPVDLELKYNLISDIEALIMQLQSCWEIMRTFTISVLNIKAKSFQTSIVIQE